MFKHVSLWRDIPHSNHHSYMPDTTQENIPTSLARQPCLVLQAPSPKVSPFCLGSSAHLCLARNRQCSGAPSAKLGFSKKQSQGKRKGWGHGSEVPSLMCISTPQMAYYSGCFSTPHSSNRSEALTVSPQGVPSA